jgi:hypothetical protein
MSRGLGRFVRQNTIALLALFVALSGTTFAAANVVLPKNSVGAKQLKKNAVTTPKIKNGAVTGAKIKNGTITGGKISLSTLGKVPSAANADHATSAGSATTAGHATTADQATLASSLGGGFAAILSEHPGALPISATFTSSGRPLLFQVSGSAFASTAGRLLAITVSIDGLVRGEMRGFTNEAGSHKALPVTSFVVTGLASGSHTLTLAAVSNGNNIDTNTDGNDFFSAWMSDLPTGLALWREAGEPNDTIGTYTQMQPCAGFGGVPYFLGTIAPAGNDDWIFPNCATTGNNKLTVVGGPTMDVYNETTKALLASNVTTFTAASTFWEVRIHSATAAAYTFLDTKPDGSPLSHGSGVSDVRARR